MNIQNKVVVVTGVGGGGRAAVRLIESAGGCASFVHADLGIETEMRGLIDFAEQTRRGLDVVVNSAGPYFHGAKLER